MTLPDYVRKELRECLDALREEERAKRMPQRRSDLLRGRDVLRLVADNTEGDE